MLTPVLVHAFPRSGSTLLMMVLSCLSGVQFCREYPFEERDLTYIVRLAQLACRSTERASRDFMLGPYGSLHGYPYHPTCSFFDDTAEGRAGVFLQLWEGYSRSIAQLGTFSMYAEKVPLDVADFVRPILPTREIVLVRDPRAVFNSILKFDAKRGFYAFGRQHEDNELDYALRFADMQKSYLAAMRNIASEKNSLFISYEALMSDFRSGLRSIEEFLQRDIDVVALGDCLGRHVEHTTSKSSLSSIDQWRTDLDPDVAALIASRLTEEISFLGL